MFWIFISSSNKTNILNSSSVKCSCIALMREIYLIIIFLFKNKTHIFAKKEFMLHSVSVRDNKNTFWDL